MRGNADNQIKPHTIRWIDFANWAIKNIPGDYDIHLDWDPRTNEINAIYIGRDRIDEDTFIAATLEHGFNANERRLKLEYFKINREDGSRKYCKKLISERPDHKFPLFSVNDRVLDKMPRPREIDDDEPTIDDDFYNYSDPTDEYNW